MWFSHVTEAKIVSQKITTEKQTFQYLQIIPVKKGEFVEYFYQSYNLYRYGYMVLLGVSS